MVITTYSHSDMPVSASATDSTSPSTWMPTIAWRRKPTVSGSVTATICITPWSSSFWTRWRTAASDRPTALPIAAYGRRPSSWSCSMMARETASRFGLLPFLDSPLDSLRDPLRDSRESLGSALRLDTTSLCTTSRRFRKVEAMKFVVYVTETCGFRSLGGIRGVENVGLAIRVGVSVSGQFQTLQEAGSEHRAASSAQLHRR